MIPDNPGEVRALQTLGSIRSDRDNMQLDTVPWERALPTDRAAWQLPAGGGPELSPARCASELRKAF